MDRFTEWIRGHGSGLPGKDCYTKLAEYEDLEEQGKLLKLPCAVGDTVYSIQKGLTYGEVGDDADEWYKIDKVKFTTYMIDSFGNTVFLTREEAEAALKELSGADE